MLEVYEASDSATSHVSARCWFKSELQQRLDAAQVHTVAAPGSQLAHLPQFAPVDPNSSELRFDMI